MVRYLMISCTKKKSNLKIHEDHCRLAPTWQYFGTITFDRLHGIMKLHIDKP